MSKQAVRSFGKNSKTLQSSIKCILVMAQCFGLLPVSGISEDDVHKLKFKWFSFRTVYSIIIILPTLVVAFMALYRIFRSDAVFNNLNPVAFYFCCAIIGIVYLHLARGWPSLMVHWRRMEIAMNCYNTSFALRTVFHRIAALVLTTAFIEHLLSNFNSYVYVRDKSDVELIYFYVEYPFIFDYIDYNLSLAIFLKILSFINTFAWNFLDVFIIIMSTALAERFRQINKRVRHACATKEKSPIYWMSVREDFNRLCKLCRRLDSQISYVILTSFGNNIFFILVQLYKSLKRRETVLESVYFFFSFGLLLARTVAVCLYAASVNDESKKPLRYMYTVPSSMYNEEMQRLMQQIHIEDVALTGKRFFKITRGLIFRIAGTIVTYELFLFQFNVNINS